MTEHPIIFSGEMVRAILDGRKTQTRRVIVPQPPVSCKEAFYWGESSLPRNPSAKVGAYFHTGDTHNLYRKCPYGVVGDRLWVRETRWINGGYVATDTPNINHEGKRPSIFMKKIYARIWLEITGIRVERAQDIWETHIISEGCPEFESLHTIDDLYIARLNWFKGLWDSLNAKRGYSWESNPYVWVIEFKKEQK